MFLGFVKCCYALLPFATYLDGNIQSNQFPGSHLYSFQPTNTLLHIFIRHCTCCYALLPVVTSLKVCQISFQVPILYSFQPTNTLLHMFIWLVTCCYALLQVVTSLEGISLSKYFRCSTLIFVSNPPIPCCICSLDFVRVVTPCYLLLYFQSRKVCQIRFQVPILYSFPTHEYHAAYVHQAVTCCYVLLRVITFYYIFRGETFVKLVSRFPFYISSNPRIPCCICPLGLLRVVKGCYALLHVITSLEGKSLSNQFPGSHFIFISNPRIPCCICLLGCYVLLRVVTRCYILLQLQRGNVSQISFQVSIYYSFPTTNTLLHKFIGLVTCCYALLPVVIFLEAKRFSNQIPGSHFIFVSNPRIPFYICSLGLIRVVKGC